MHRQKIGPVREVEIVVGSRKKWVVEKNCVAEIHEVEKNWLVEIRVVEIPFGISTTFRSFLIITTNDQFGQLAMAI